VCISPRGFYIWPVSCQSTLVVIWNVSHRDDGDELEKQYLDIRQRPKSIYSTNNSSLPLMIQLQSEPRSHIKLFKTFSVYIIVLCPENASTDTVTGLNWIPGTDKMDTYRTPARFPVFEWVLYQEQTFTDKRQSTRNRRQTRFLPLEFCHHIFEFWCQNRKLSLFEGCVGGVGGSPRTSGKFGHRCLQKIFRSPLV